MLIRVKKKGKTVGRPSKVEKKVEKMVNWFMKQPEFRTEFDKRFENLMLYGTTHPEMFMTIVEIAEEFAKIQHRGQLDDEGKDYFECHVCQVVNILRQVTDDKTILAAAYLHDTMEDCEVSHRTIELLCGTEVADLVYELTHEGSKGPGYTFPRLKSKKAILIKFADRLSNLSRMSAWDDDRQEHYLKRSKFWKD